MANSIRKHLLGSFAGMVLCSAAAIAAPQQAQDQTAAPHPLAWAYAVPPPAPPPPPPPADDGTLKRIPGSDKAFTVTQLRDTGNPVDWFPGDHPPMPTIVAHPRSPNLNPWIGSCGLGHYSNGKGRPEKGGIAGVPPG